MSSKYKKIMVMTAVGLTVGNVVDGFLNSPTILAAVTQQEGKESPYAIDYTAADKAIAAAKKKGMSVKITTKKVVAKTPAEAQKLKEQYEQSRDTQLKNVNHQSELYDQWAKNNSTLEGVAPDQLKQSLVLGSEPDAKSSISIKNPAIKVDKFNTKDYPHEAGSGEVGDFMDTPFVYRLQNKAGGKINTEGDVAEVTYSNLQHSSYQGKKISKIVKVFSNIKTDTPWGDKNSSLVIASNPAMGFFMRNGVYSVDRRYTKMYDENGKEITLGDDALGAIMSLNANQHATSDPNSHKPGAPFSHREQVKSGGKLYKLKGSSINVHGQLAYADADNSQDGSWTPDPFRKWDSATAPNNIYGAVVESLKLNQVDTFSIYQDKDAKRRHGTNWVFEQTKLPISVPQPMASFEKVNIALKEDVKMTSTPVDKNGKEIAHNGLKFPSFTGNEGDTVTIKAVDLPDIPGYNKPTKDITTTIEKNKVVKLPYTKKPKVVTTVPVDKDRNKLTHAGINFPKVTGQPGDKVTIDKSNIPDIPGYNKPKQSITVTIPNDDKPIEIPYTKKPTPSTVPSIPVDKDGNKLPHDGVKFPTFTGFPGDKITVDPNNIPNLDGYNKPNRPIEVTIPKDGRKIEIPYTKKPTPSTVPSIPVDKDGNKLPHNGVKFPTFTGFPGDKITVDPNNIPDLDGYNKPNKPVEVIIPKDGKEIEIPYIKKPQPLNVPTIPVDKDGNKLPHEGITFPTFTGQPGEKVTLDKNNIPDIPGYDKPTKTIETVIPKDGKPIEVPYTKVPTKNPEKPKLTPSIPVDKEGRKLPHDGINFPTFTGKAGDKVTIDPKSIPEIDGYDKPTKTIETVIPKEGEAIEIPYTQKEKQQLTPSIPVDKNGKGLEHKGIDFPMFTGKPGDKVTISPNNIPDIPGYDKPTKTIETVIPKEGESIKIPYTQKEKQQLTPSIPVDKDGKELAHKGIGFPTFTGKLGDKVTIDPNDIPNLDGYDKPTNPVETVIPKEGESIKIPYTQKEKQRETPSIPVDKNGKGLDHKGIDFPTFTGKPGDKIVINPSQIPDLEGYTKPKESVKVVIPDNGEPIKLPYEKIDDTKNREEENKPEEQQDTSKQVDTDQSDQKNVSEPKQTGTEQAEQEILPESQQAPRTGYMSLLTREWNAVKRFFKQE